MQADRGDVCGEAAPEAELSSEAERVYVASQWQLIWWRFRKHRLANLGAIVLGVLYLCAAFCEFVAPYDPNGFEKTLTFVPPQRVHLVRGGALGLRPVVYGLKRTRDPETLVVSYEEDRDKAYPIAFFVHGDQYRLWGLFSTDRHLVGLGPQAGTARAYFLGSDRLGRDMLSRVLYGARISLSIGLVGVLLSFGIGIVVGGISGYRGGRSDAIIQRLIEFLRSLPTTPLWMGLSAALPREWGAIERYLAIVVILSLIGWTGLARVVRGRFLSLRNEDFVLAARLSGAGEARIILRHMLPSFLSYIIASLTLSIPGMILGETALSFLSLGLRPPSISWGVLLKEAQDLNTVALAPWLLLPALFIVAAVLSFNFMGDGLRDAADPYGR